MDRKLLGVHGAANLAHATLQYSTMGKSLAMYGLEPYVEDYDMVSAEEAFSWAGEKFMNYIMRPMCYGNGGTAMADALRFRSASLHLRQR